VVKPLTSARLAAAIKRAIAILGDSAHWRELQEAGMSQDFSWRVSATKYVELYGRLIAQAP
jgi:starch synthase